VVHNPDTVELSEAIEGIVKQLERDTEGDVMTDDRFGGPKVMVVNTTGNGRISGIRDDEVISKMDFPNSFRIEANGFVGGIWFLWSDNILVDILELHP
ncbi:hypothetical protein ES332_D05G345200v1, partial [Gossypium tomentosum]